MEKCRNFASCGNYVPADLKAYHICGDCWNGVADRADGLVKKQATIIQGACRGRHHVDDTGFCHCGVYVRPKLGGVEV